MQVLEPIVVTAGMIQSSNLTEDDHPEWDAATDYFTADRVISTTTHQVYQALQTTGPGSQNATDPDVEWSAIDDRFDLVNTGPVTWDRVSATNAYRLFDQSPTDATSNTAVIDVTLVPGQFVEGLAFFNLAADSIQVTVTNAGIVEYDQTIALADSSGVIDWWSYWTSKIKETEQYVVTNLPPFGAAEIRIQINRPNGVAGCGEIVMGALVDLGKTKTKPKIKLLDYSKVEEDQYGNLSTTVRGATQEIAYEFWITGLRTESAFNTLKGLRGAQKAVWIGDGESRLSLINYGYLKTLEMEVEASAGPTRANTFAKILTRGVL